jgi:NADH:ubiquinone oxidoreductase subunit 4 (subunit M)
MKDNIKEFMVTVCLVALAVLLLNPFHFWMPDMMVMGMLACILVLFGIFASFILREKIFDERDSAHRTLAGRNAFLAGSSILMLGIIVQGYSHQVDAWLVITLIGMILTKIGTRIWSDKNL